MTCKKCGKEIEGKRLFCPACGAEVQMIPEYNSQIEDELQQSMERLKVETPQDAETDEELEEEWEEFHLEKRDTKRQKKMKLIASIVALATVIVITIVVILVVAISSLLNSSYNSQMDIAQKNWKKGNYEDAISAYENAIEKSDNDTMRAKALCKLASLYVETGDENSAIYYYEEAAQLKKMTDEDVTVLVNLYENKADIAAIRKLAKNYSSDATKKLFEKHLLNQPIFNYKSGTYNEFLTVTITAEENEQIFYTLDNTQATPQSTPYTDPIQIGEGTTIVRAVTLNQNGLLSDEITTTYVVKLDVPPIPVITPDTGSYSETSKITIQNIPTNCTAYYTIDGTTPTKDSIPYTKPFDMMLGNNVVMAVCINDYTGQAGQPAMKIYDFSINGKISWTEAPGRVMNRLQEIGEVVDGNGTMADGSTCTLLATTVVNLNGNRYYIVKRYQNTNGGLKETGAAYAVNTNSGSVFRAEDNGNGQYNLSGL